MDMSSRVSANQVIYIHINSLLIYAIYQELARIDFVRG